MTQTKDEKKVLTAEITTSNNVKQERSLEEYLSSQIQKDGCFQTKNSNIKNQIGAVYYFLVNAFDNITITNDNKTVFYKLMKSESNRLCSFSLRNSFNWPHKFLSVEDLANAGFIHVSYDKVMCVFCRGMLNGWLKGDHALGQHALHFPRCPFMMHCDVGNKPIKKDPMQEPQIHVGRDVCGFYRPSMDHIYRSSKSSLRIDKYPKIKEFCSLEKRIVSFKENKWESKLTLNIMKFAKSGFFYTGYKDWVICFYCNGGLHDWENCDDPFKEHAKWYPNCHFLKLNNSYEKENELISVGVLKAIQNKDLKNKDKLSIPQTMFEKENCNLCKVCLDRELNVLYLPCRHIVTCSQCAFAFTSCPICFKEIVDFIKVFIS